MRPTAFGSQGMLMRIYILFFLLVAQLLLPTQSFGQDNTTQRTTGFCDSPEGGFAITPEAGCAPLPVTVRNTVPGVTDDDVFYIYGFDRNSTVLAGLTGVKTQTFNIVGTRTILQQVYKDGRRQYLCKDIKVYESGQIAANFSSCGGGKIVLALVDNAILRVYDEVLIQWGDGETETWKGGALNLEHTYANVASSPVITIKGIYTGNTDCKEGRPTTLPVSFNQPQLANIAVKTIEMNGGGQLSITYFGVTSIATDILYSADGTNFTRDATQSFGGSSLYWRFRTTLDKSKIYTVKLSSKDLCGSTLESPMVSSMVLSGSSANETNTLTWNAYPDNRKFESYEVRKNGDVIATITDRTITKLDDSDVQCGDFNEYQVVAKTEDITSTSAPILLETTLSGSNGIEEAVVSVNGDQLVQIHVEVPGAGSKGSYELGIERAEAGSTTWRKLASLFGEQDYSDQNVKTNEHSYCYRLTYKNSCGQSFPATPPICTILLSAPNIPAVSWTAESPMLSNLGRYDVIQTGSATGTSEHEVGLATTYSPKFDTKSDLEYSFQVKATSDDGNFESLSNTLVINRNATVFLPDAFSPNEDSYNNTFEAKGNEKMIKAFKMSIYNRWGAVVFHSEDIKVGWGGKVGNSNVDAPVGSYAYKVTITDILDQTVEKNGTFMLFR